MEEIRHEDIDTIIVSAGTDGDDHSIALVYLPVYFVHFVVSLAISS